MDQNVQELLSRQERLSTITRVRRFCQYLIYYIALHSGKEMNETDLCSLSNLSTYIVFERFVYWTV